MANYPRSCILFDGALFHVTWKCHNHAFLLRSWFAKQTYYDLLLKYKKKYGVEIFSYCLMDNHPHLTGVCQTQVGLSNFFKVVNSCFSKRLNAHLHRNGQTVMDRFKSPQIQSDEGLREVMIYIDLNPFRTCKKIHPKDFKWSSYHHYAHGKTDPLITEPEFYRNLGATPEERCAKYQKMICDILGDDWRDLKSKSLSKKNYSLTLFIGDPLWVKEKFAAMKSRRQNQKRNLATETTEGASPPSVH